MSLKGYQKMQTITGSFWVLLFLAMVALERRAEELINSTGGSQGNATTLNVAKLPGGMARGKHYGTSDTEVGAGDNKSRYNSYHRGGGGGNGGGGGRGGGGGGSFGWGWGGGGGGGGGEGGGGGGGGLGWGWGWGGGGGGYYKWGCGGKRKNRGGGGGGRGDINHKQVHGKRSFNGDDYKLGEFAQCMKKGRCKGMRLDCPLHCNGPCFYDCQFMCKAHCGRS